MRVISIYRHLNFEKPETWKGKNQVPQNGIGYRKEKIGINQITAKGIAIGSYLRICPA